MSFTIKVPSSSANIGSGFDVIGLALNLFLEISVSIDPNITGKSLNCIIEYEGDGKEEVSLDPETNLITRVAVYVLRCHNQRQFPATTKSIILCLSVAASAQVRVQW
jgi:homoserine kinase